MPRKKASGENTERNGDQNLSRSNDEYLEGIEAIALFLQQAFGPSWTVRKVRYAREVGALPVRKREGLGIYAFKSELIAAFRDLSSLPPDKGDLVPKAYRTRIPASGGCN